VTFVAKGKSVQSCTQFPRFADDCRQRCATMRTFVFAAAELCVCVQDRYVDIHPQRCIRLDSFEPVMSAKHAI
jgi:hypothetical protein